MSTRRQTLGSISQSQLNAGSGGGAAAQRVLKKGRQSLGAPAASSRKSLGGGRQSFGGGLSRQSIGGRQSIGASLGRPSLGGGRQSIGRRSSIHANSTGTSDPRPLSDKAYKNASCRKLIEFLASSGYPHSISPKMLTAPSNKDFVQIFQFLYNAIDPNYDFGQEKPEDQVPTLLKHLGYPFTINRSAIFSCGSSHTWPKLLGALTWMVDTIQYMQKVDLTQMISQSDFSDAGNDSLEFFEYIASAYHSFLAGADDEIDQIVMEMENNFEIRNKAAQRSMDTLHTEMESMDLEYKQMTTGPTPLEQLKHQAALLNGDIAKFGALISKLEVHKTAIQDKFAQQSNDKKRLDAEYEGLVQEQLRLQHLFDTQEMTQQDVERINSQRKKLETQKMQVRQEQERADELVWSSEISQSKALEKVEGHLHNFQRFASALGLPSEIVRDVSLNSIDQIHRKIEDIKNMFNVEIIKQREEILKQTELLDSLKESNSNKRAEIAEFERKLARLTEEAEQTHTQMQLESQKVARDLEEYHSQITALRQNHAMTQQEAERRLQRLEFDFKQLEATQEQEKAQALRTAHHMLELVKSHKALLASELCKLQQFVSTIDE
eukprot:m.220652 g.220652  ORF g.220652 m.220652 type:complete len:606 (+) comp10803_c0_seq1:147-1964(+)